MTITTIAIAISMTTATMTITTTVVIASTGTITVTVSKGTLPKLHMGSSTPLLPSAGVRVSLQASGAEDADAAGLWQSEKI